MTPCPACGTNPSDSWIALASTAAGDPVPTQLCPGCTLARTGTAGFGLDAGYRARVCTDDHAMRLEADDGRIVTVQGSERDRVVRGRIDDLLQALAAARQGRRVRVLQIGLRDPMPAEAIEKLPHVNVLALEPWQPWAAAARARGLAVQQRALEAMTGRGRFDLVVEHDVLPHLPDPIAHLQAIAARLSSGGVAVIEVPNLLHAMGNAADEVLSPLRAWAFTPRALATACRRAGLQPFFMHADQRLRVLCRRGAPQHGSVPGPSAREVAEAVWGNDLRLQLKRALAQVGATAAALRTAAAIHGRCTIAAVRADLALEIANAYERNSDLDSTAAWLATSLRDRPDAAVSRMLEQVEALRERVAAVWSAMPAANDPMPPGHQLRLAC
ncbi:MAG: class I SAM-dependent methyltransferase [Nannocystaceae bacterium]|nr:class I SAM-dependent methyltransferase [Nannocystaceae bacterium]